MPTFHYAGTCYPAGAAPFVSSFDPSLWLEGTFGLLPHWADPKLARQTYNARSETVATKPCYRTAWRQRQLAVIPVEAFYEPNYESGKAERWRIARDDGEPFGLAGIWERRQREDGASWWSFSMLTINADEHPLMRRFHKLGDEKRSVVILDDEDWDDWLSAKSEADIRSMLVPFRAELMVAVPA